MKSIKNLQKEYSEIIFPIFLLIVAYVIKKKKEFVLTYPEYKLSFLKKIKIRYYLWRYYHGLPIAYITHHKEFFGLDFYVNKHTLIPRPETELMVEEVIQRIKNKELGNRKRIMLIDVGTGSGCIPISIIKTLKHKNIKTFAIDISKSTLQVAKKNARLHNVNINFLRGSLLEPFLQKISNKTMEQCNNGTIFITANLPYLTDKQFKNEPSIQKEPRHALVASENGLKWYKILIEQIKTLYIMRYTLYAYFEIDPSQTKSITSLIRKSLSAAQITIKQDLNGRDRLVIIEY